MWLNGDSDTLQVETGDFENWLADTAKAVVATSAAVGLTAVIHKISGHVVNIGLPQQNRLGAPGTQYIPVSTQAPTPPSSYGWQSQEAQHLLDNY